jgi:hypothetical protein
LIELACIDLIERRRAGQEVSIESYLKPFPQLEQDEPLLDLIDAEICVVGELKQSIDPQSYQRRFPRLAKEIEELLGLEGSARTSGVSFGAIPVARRAGPASTHDGDSRDPSASFSVELSVTDDAHASDALPSVGGHPLLAPEWFAAEKCFASGPGRWLIRGRDATRSVVMAMKVIQLTSQLHPGQSDRILDACEAASKVENPMWVSPKVAAIQHRHLGVIRPWVFAVSWRSVADKRDVASQLRDLASIAYCLQGAHQTGATHGAIHCENILLDHEGKLRLVDAVANRDGLRRWLEQVDDSHVAGSILSLTERKQADTEDLIRLIASLATLWRKNWTGQLIDDLGALASSSSEQAPGAIGETLLRYADCPPKATKHSPSWRNTWKRWLSS